MVNNRKASVLGGGVIGAGWVARFLLMGWNVNVYDPDPEAPRKIQAVMEMPNVHCLGFMIINSLKLAI